MTVDDLTRRAIIAAHDAGCSPQCSEDSLTYGGLTTREQAIVARWRADRSSYYEIAEEGQGVAAAACEDRDSACKALAEIVRERNDWGRRLADAVDEARSALDEAEEARRARAQAENERTALTVRAEEAEAAIERALAIWRRHTDSHKPAPSACICIACEMGRALDGTETTDGTR